MLKKKKKRKERKKETGQKKPGAIGPGKTRTTVLGSEKNG